MSKAMDALEHLASLPDDGDDGKGYASYIILRDYITTTEAREAAWAIVLAGEQLAHETDLTKSAARIKELEEQVAAYAAVPVGMQFMNDPGMLERSWPIDFLGENGNYMCICSTCGEHFIGHKRRLTCRKCDTPALSGARKVNSLGSVRGDEHLGAMLPDEAIFDARKVEP